MKPSNYIILGVIGLLSWVAYNHSEGAKASIADAAVEAAARKVGLSDGDCKEAGKAVKRIASGANAAFDAANDVHHVSAPAASPNLQGQIDQLGKDHDALMARVAALEARKECVCNMQAAKPEAPPVLIETQTYKSGCANGQCGTGFSRGFFGRRR